jgi:hypothetical protein
LSFHGQVESKRRHLRLCASSRLCVQYKIVTKDYLQTVLHSTNFHAKAPRSKDAKF